MLNILKKKPIAIKIDTLENLAKSMLDVISQNNQEVIELILQEQFRNTVLISVISEELGFNETEIINKINEKVESKWEGTKQEIKEHLDMARQINEIFDKKEEG